MRKQSLGALLSIAVLVSSFGLTSTLPAAGAASTTENSATRSAARPCLMSEMEKGKVLRFVSTSNRKFLLTHAVLRRVARGTTFSRAVTLSNVRTLKSSISGTATVKAEGGIWAAKVSAEVSATVAKDKSSTTSSSITESYTIPATSKDRVFVFYSGRTTYRMSLLRRYCHHGGQTDTRGTFNTYRTVDDSGNVLCPRSRYGKNTIRYQIALQGGC